MPAPNKSPKAQSRKSSASKKTANKGLVINRKFPVSALAVIAAVFVTGILVYNASRASGAVVISEDFSSSAANFTTVKGGAWAVHNGTYQLTNPAQPASSSYGNANYAVHELSVAGDFTEEADFNVTSTSATYNDASMIFDWTDPSNYYYASFNETSQADTNGIFRISGGVQTRLVAFSPTFAPGVTRHATIMRSGSTVTASINSAAIASVTTTLPASGRLGFGSRNDSVTYDNFKVTVPNTTAPTTPTGLASPSKTSSTVSLAWNASTDKSGVAGYHVLRNGIRVGIATSPSFTDSGLKASTSYSYTVNAFDAAGNRSSNSNTVAVTTSPSVNPSGQTIVSSTFDNYPVSAPISVTNYKAAMGNPSMSAGTGNLVNTSVIAAAGHGNVLRQTLKANGYGSGDGIVTFPPLTQTVDEASIQYDIRFDSNFDWGWGGKLPGLGGAVPGTDPGIASGCANGNSYAWSGRAMWITPGSYGSVNGSNELIGYMYNYNKKADCGDNVYTGKAFTPGAWHTIKQYYKLNTPGSANGIHRMWLDGTQIVNNTSFSYRNNSSLHINHIFWAIFRGGSTVQWAGNRTGYIDIDNLEITTP